jgi:hypothetical protein
MKELKLLVAEFFRVVVLDLTIFLKRKHTAIVSNRRGPVYFYPIQKTFLVSFPKLL